MSASVAQAGYVSIDRQYLGRGSFTVKQNGIDIPSGAAGERYNVAGFDPNTLVGLYLLTGWETAPAGDFTIESDFTPIMGGLGGYDFTMPDTPVIICAVFSDYASPAGLSMGQSMYGSSEVGLAVTGLVIGLVLGCAITLAVQKLRRKKEQA